MTLPLTGGVGAVAGFVLAGGESSRMGRDKALVELAGRPLVEHALGVLREVGLAARIAGARADLSGFAPVVADEGGGPLSGVCAALESTAADLAVFLPVDMPLLPGSLVQYLIHHARVTGAAVAVARVNGYAQTFPALVRRAALPWLREALAKSAGGCFEAFQRAAEGLDQPFAAIAAEGLAQSGQVEHTLGLPVARWFLNLNSPGDLKVAERLVSGEFA